MKKTTLLFILALSVCLTSCTTSKTVISSAANLEKYNYATITNVMHYGGSAVLMDMEVKIYDALSETRLQVIGEKQLDILSNKEKQELLLVRFAATQSEEESVVSINFVDYSTGLPVASCRGAYSLGFTTEQNTNVAVNKALNQMKSIF